MRGSSCSFSRALAAAASGRRQLAGVGWALAVLVKWVPLILLPLRALEARATGRRVGHVGFALPSSPSRSRVRALRDGMAATFRTARAQCESRDELGAAAPARAARRSSPARDRRSSGVRFVLAYAWLVARGVARHALASGWRRARCCSRLPYLVVWYVVWAVPLAAAEDDEPAALLSLVLCAYLSAADHPALSAAAAAPGGRRAPRPARKRVARQDCAAATRPASRSGAAQAGPRNRAASRRRRPTSRPG